MSINLSALTGLSSTTAGSVVNRLYKSDPFPSYNISLTVELIYDIPIRAVKNFSKMNNYEPIREGGLNDYVHMKRKPIDQPFTFEIERYVTSALTDPLSTGTELVLPVILWLDEYNNGGGGWDDSKTAKMFVFTNCQVMGRTYSEFNSESSALAVETIKISYAHMYAISSLTDLVGDLADITSDDAEVDDTGRTKSSQYVEEEEAADEAREAAMEEWEEKKEEMEEEAEEEAAAALEEYEAAIEAKAAEEQAARDAIEAARSASSSTDDSEDEDDDSSSDSDSSDSESESES